MTARIGDHIQHQRLLQDVATTRARMHRTQTAVASGKTSQRFDEIADRAALLLAARQDRTMVEARIRRNEELLGRLRAMDGAVASLSDIAERARVLVLRRLEPGTGDALPLDTEVEAMLEQVQAELNQEFGGVYVFAGSRTDAPPVALPDPPPTTADSSLYYQGDEVTLTASVDAGVELRYGVTAADPAFARLIGSLGAAREAHLSGDEDGLRNALSGLTLAIEEIADLRGEIGANMSRLEGIVDAQRGEQTYLQEVVSRIEDTDVPEALTSLARDQMLLEAAFVTISRMARLTLSEYLR